MLSERPYLFKAVIVSPPPRAEKAPLSAIADNKLFVPNLVSCYLKPCRGIIVTFINKFANYRDVSEKLNLQAMISYILTFAAIMNKNSLKCLPLAVYRLFPFVRKL